MHHLYAQSTDLDMGAAVLLRNLDKSLDEVHDLFAWDISAFLRLNREARAHYERMEQRSTPDKTVLDRISRFTSISFFTTTTTVHSATCGCLVIINTFTTASSCKR